MLWYGEVLFNRSTTDPLKHNLFNGFPPHDVNKNLQINVNTNID